MHVDESLTTTNERQGSRYLKIIGHSVADVVVVGNNPGPRLGNDNVGGSDDASVVTFRPNNGLPLLHSIVCFAHSTSL
jgi:hypothetical protein